MVLMGNVVRRMVRRDSVSPTSCTCAVSSERLGNVDAYVTSNK